MLIILYLKKLFIIVPKYEVVPIAYTFNKRSARKSLKTRFFGQYIVLDLSPVREDVNSKYTKIWKGRKNDSSPTGVRFTYVGEAHSVSSNINVKNIYKLLAKEFY